MRVGDKKDKDFIDRTGQFFNLRQLLTDLLRINRSVVDGADRGPVHTGAMAPYHDYIVSPQQAFRKRYNASLPIPGDRDWSPAEEFGMRMMERDKYLFDAMKKYNPRKFEKKKKK